MKQIQPLQVWLDSPEGQAYLAEDAAIHDWIEAGAPDPATMWQELRRRGVVAENGTPLTTLGPLTVAQAAERERVSEKTIRRWLPELAADHGAWRTGGDTGSWRIDADALDRRRARGPKPRPRKKADTSVTLKTKRKAATGSTSNPASWL